MSYNLYFNQNSAELLQKWIVLSFLCFWPKNECTLTCVILIHLQIYNTVVSIRRFGMVNLPFRFVSISVTGMTRHSVQARRMCFGFWLLFLTYAGDNW